MNYILFDDSSRDDLLPLTFTRPISELRIGILTITEKWNKYLNANCSFHTQEYLAKKFPVKAAGDNLLINGSILPNPALISAIAGIKTGQRLVREDVVVAIRMDKADLDGFSIDKTNKYDKVECSPEFVKINFPWDIFSKNGQAIEDDFKIIVKGRKSPTAISNTNKCINPENIFVEEGAIIECSILNASTGPIYIGRNAEIMENTVVRGPFALCDHSTLKLGAKIYGPTTIGPYSKVGGEVNNSVIIGSSNKGHDGFLGNSVLGEWCNIGADTNNSNLKNNYAEVKLWNYKNERFINTGLQFCGLIMGDHSKCGINTMFNTGTVVGVNANLFGAGFQRNFVPSFSWGGPQGLMVYQTAKAFETAELVLKRRGLELYENDKAILTTVFDLTQKYRRF